MVLKSVPDVHGRDVDSQIGAPQDYSRNAENGDFPAHYDLRIPGGQAKSGQNRVSEADIAGALGDAGSRQNNHESHGFPGEEAKVARRSYEQTGQLAGGSDPHPDMYMPIKALNQFSNDWIIKARVVKKAAIRQYKNAKGEG